MAATALTPEEKNFAHLLAIAVVESARKRSPKNVRAKHASPKKLLRRSNRKLVRAVRAQHVAPATPVAPPAPPAPTR